MRPSKFKLELHDYQINYVHSDLQHQYGISVIEAQSTFLQTRGGGGVLPHMGYIGTCRGIGYRF